MDHARDGAQYRKDYERGWRYSNTASANLDTADSRGWSSNNAWMDGYLDMAAGRHKWHHIICLVSGRDSESCTVEQHRFKPTREGVCDTCGRRRRVNSHYNEVQPLARIARAPEVN